jgi:phosphoribosyl-dephospho-CoA transferase
MKVTTTAQIVNELRNQRSQAEREIEKLNLAIKALTGIDVTGPGPVRRKSKFSKVGLARIAAAQRARWKKWKAAKKK